MYAWDTRRASVWAAHIMVLAPLLFLGRNTPLALGVLLAIGTAYHVHRVQEHGCKNTYAELNLFHLVFAFPLLAYLAHERNGRALAIVTALMVAYFTSKFVLYTKCIPPGATRVNQRHAAGPAPSTTGPLQNTN